MGAVSFLCCVFPGHTSFASKWGSCLEALVCGWWVHPRLHTGVFEVHKGILPLFKCQNKTALLLDAALEIWTWLWDIFYVRKGSLVYAGVHTVSADLSVHLVNKEDALRHILISPEKSHLYLPSSILQPSLIPSQGHLLMRSWWAFGGRGYLLSSPSWVAC